MSREATIVIPGEFPSQNEIIDAAKLGNREWQPYNVMKQRYTNLVAWETKSQTKEKFEKIDVEVTFICKDKRKDKDNILSGIKFILDGLVRAGLIKNDGWKQIGDISFKFKTDKDNPRVEVKVMETN